MSIYVEEMLEQIEDLDAFCERLQRRMQMDPVPTGMEVEADELVSRIKNVERDLQTGLDMGDWGRKAHFIRYYLAQRQPSNCENDLEVFRAQNIPAAKNALKRWGGSLAELQASKETSGALARRYGLSRTTVTKWRNRTTTGDAPMGPTSPRSTVLSAVEEAMIVEFRRRTLLPLDDVLGCLRDTIPRLTRSSLHRCLERHGISRLPPSPDQASKRGSFADTTIGYVHIDTSDLRLAQGKLVMFLATDRVSKFTYVEFRDNAGKMNGADFLRGVVAAFPYAIHTVLTDNGVAFADLPKNRGRHPELEAMFGGHIFDRVCRDHGIRHRLTKQPSRPSTTPIRKASKPTCWHSSQLTTSPSTSRRFVGERRSKPCATPGRTSPKSSN